MMKLSHSFPSLAFLFFFAQHAHAEVHSCALRLSVTDASNQNVPYRGYLQNEAGEAIFPPGTVQFELTSSYPERHFIATGPLDISLPPGRYTLSVERGLEWKPSAQDIVLNSNDPVALNVKLERWVDMNALGWYSGDMHIHRYPRDMETAFLAEDLNFCANITNWNGKDAYKASQLPLPKSSYYQPDPLHALNLRAQETERLGDGWGAALFLGEFEMLKVPSHPYFPLTAMVCEEARKRGAHIDFEKPVWKDTPVAAALGLVDSIGIIHNHFHPGAVLPMGVVRDAIIPPPSLEMSPREMARYTLGLYDHLLNCGLRIPVSAGTASGVMPTYPGYARTYVKLDVPFTPQVWLEQLRAGRNFATNGPLLFVEVEGHGLGDVIDLPGAAQELRVKVEAKSQFPRLEMLELVHNGKVIATAEGKDAASLHIDQSLKLNPGWVSARVFEGEGAAQVFAVTSPVYLQHGEDRGIVPESARYYADLLQAMIAQASDEKRFPEGADEQTAMGILNKALTFYQERNE